MTKQDLSKAPEGYSQINWDNMTDKDKKVILRVKKRSSSLTPRAEGRAAEENVGREGTQPTNKLYDPTAPSLDSQPLAQAQPEVQIEPQYQTPEQQAELNHASIEEVEVEVPVISLSREAFREDISDKRRKTKITKPFDDVPQTLQTPADDYNLNQMAEVIEIKQKTEENSLDNLNLDIFDEAEKSLQSEGVRSEDLESPRITPEILPVEEPKITTAEEIIPLIGPQENVIPSGNKPGDTLNMGTFEEGVFAHWDENQKRDYIMQSLMGEDIKGLVAERLVLRFPNAKTSNSQLEKLKKIVVAGAVCHLIDNPEDMRAIYSVAEGVADDEIENIFGSELYSDNRTTRKLEAATTKLLVQKPKRGGLLGLIAGASVIGAIGLAGIIGYNLNNKNSNSAKPESNLEKAIAAYSNNDKVSNTEKPSMFIEMPENFQKTPDPRENQTTFEYTENPEIYENAPLEEPEIVKENPTTPKVEIKTESNNPAENFGKEPFAYSTTQKELEERLSNEERELTDVEQARKDMADNYLAQNRFNNIPNPNLTQYNLAAPKTPEVVTSEVVTSANWYAFAQGGVKVPIFNRKGEEAPNPTWVVEAGVGRKFATGLSLEVKAGHSEYTDTKTEAGNYASIEEVENSVGLGFLYNQPISEDWTFKIGTGVGATFRDTDVEFGNSSIPTIQVHDSEVVPYIELNVGAGYNVTKNFSVNVNLSGKTSPEDNAGVTGTATAGVGIKF